MICVSDFERNIILEIIEKYSPDCDVLAFGSYICEDGYFHDYSKLKPKLDEAAKETVGPFNSVDDLMKSLNDE